MRRHEFSTPRYDKVIYSKRKKNSLIQCTLWGSSRSYLACVRTCTKYASEHLLDLLPLPNTPASPLHVCSFATSLTALILENNRSYWGVNAVFKIVLVNRFQFIQNLFISCPLINRSFTPKIWILQMLPFTFF